MERDNNRYDWDEYQDFDRRPEYDERSERSERRSTARSGGQSSRRRSRTPMRKKKRSAFSRSMTYILAVCGVSILLALVGWAIMGDVLALNKDPLSATITVDRDRDFDSVVKHILHFLLQIHNEPPDGRSQRRPPPQTFSHDHAADRTVIRRSGLCTVSGSPPAD